MKFVGHTMGTPEQTVAEAIELYSGVNLDAIEIACQDGGSNKAGGAEEENWKKTVEALKEVAPLAAQNDVTVLIENHPGTMTRTRQATYNLINEVASSHVRALYDPANVMRDTDEEWEHTYEVQKDIIAYVHCKDYFMEGETRKACAVGKGIVPWDKIMKKLSWYDGFMAFEYEKRWYPDQLEDAEIGVPQCIEYIKSVL